jgi:hypothetical protein
MYLLSTVATMNPAPCAVCPNATVVGWLREQSHCYDDEIVVHGVSDLWRWLEWYCPPMWGHPPQRTTSTPLLSARTTWVCLHALSTPVTSTHTHTATFDSEQTALLNHLSRCVVEGFGCDISQSRDCLMGSESEPHSRRSRKGTHLDPLRLLCVRVGRQNLQSHSVIGFLSFCTMETHIVLATWIDNDELLGLVAFENLHRYCQPKRRC